jgi:hypothetical protein
MTKTITLADIRHDSTNKVFFGNAGMFEDKSYTYNDARKELTVICDVEGLGKNRSVWSVNQWGTIGDRISHEWL